MILEVIGVKKSCTLLFVMSIISLLLALYAAISYMDASIRYSHLDSIEKTISNGGYALVLAQAAVGVGKFLDAIIFVSTLILGIFGLLSSLIKGRLSILCIILDSLPLAYMVYATIGCLIEKDKMMYSLYMTALLFFAFYMAGAVRLFKGRKQRMKSACPD